MIFGAPYGIYWIPHGIHWIPYRCIGIWGTVNRQRISSGFFRFPGLENPGNVPGGLVVELEKEVGGWFRLLQRFQRHPGIQVCSPESAELLWIPFCRSITYRVQSGFCSLDSGIQAAGRQQMVAGNSTLLRGETGDPAANINRFIWNSLVI